ncbi:hypothetical protein IDH44_01675 [Paenibacillus sp. IB182496]|uniref:GDYXXLXY domain-containing protein n=1 Tax=Paenibacillus sabuli TaxID=2772509 RepID=A0A927GQ12_9BACL|nr:hypothetical protein [Paenibacillus sabuli]MBD2843888.1 hypothetical protein [Paenibacillus sabuli]
MRKEPLILTLVLLLVGAAWLSNIRYYTINRLEAPILLQHHIDRTIAAGSWIELYYVVGRGDPRRLQALRAPGVEQPLYVEHTMGRGSYGLYEVYEAVVVIPEEESLPPGIQSPITAVEALFDDGSALRRSLGRVVLREREAPAPPFRSISGSASSEGRRSRSVEATEKMTLEQPILPPSAQPYYAQEVQVQAASSGASMPSGGGPPPDRRAAHWPVTLEPGDELQFSYTFDPPPDARRLTFYSLELHIPVVSEPASAPPSRRRGPICWRRVPSSMRSRCATMFVPSIRKEDFAHEASHVTQRPAPHLVGPAARAARPAPVRC